MYPFTKNTDYLQIESHRTCEDQGVNYINVREEWHNIDVITKEDTFVNPLWYIITGQWFTDGGDPAAPKEVRERRIYCRKGKATITFTGTCILLRIYVNPLYGSADIRIDGVLPSTLADVVDPVDVLSFNSYDYVDETLGQEYLDIPIATGITDTEHTLEIYCENDDTGLGGWCPISGYKVSEFGNKTGSRNCYIMDKKSSTNVEKFSLWNRIEPSIGREAVVNISIVFGSLFVDRNGVQLGTVTESELWDSTSRIIDFWPDIQGDEAEQTFSDTFEITANYEDPDGVVEYDHGIDWTTADEYPDLITYSDLSKWYVSDDFGDFFALINRSDIGEWLKVDFRGAYVKVFFLVLQQGGVFNAYVDDVHVGYIDTDGGDEDFYISTKSFSGFTNTKHTLKLVLIDSEEGWWTYFHSIEWQDIRTYTEVVETITYNFPSKQVPPFAPENPRFLTYGDKNPTCDPVNLGMVDYNIPRDNDGVDMLWLEKRPATFAVCYQAGFEDILKTYDIVIVEPKALTRTIVKEYQDRGIKVLCYCSYGEEVGSYENEWDISSLTVPFKGDGLGVAGYASYYNKGGNQFGECSECKHDRRRLEGIDECAKNQTANYEAAAWAGRCLNACTKDCRTCYGGYTLGYNCAGGHNKTNYYSRTAMKACTNSDCPDYNPVHGGCPYFETPDETMYGQDFSMFTTWMPDENGIWKSFYTNPRKQSWNDRLKDHYLSIIFDEGVEYTEAVTVGTHATADTSITVDGFKVSNISIDGDETVSVVHIAKDFTYVRGQDYVFDLDLGTFKMQVSSDGAPPAPWGTKLSVTYTRKGLQADGIFLDTLDTVDVYTSDEYRDAMVSMINEHHSLYPDKLWAMNRGFTILERLMPFTDFVMFESFITTINWDTGEYYEITDTAAIAANQVFIDLLFRLREIYTFNVLGLNYCDNDDDALKQTIAEKVREYGWLSWNSTISLSNPQENTEIFTKDLYIESNAWRLTDELDLP